MKKIDIAGVYLQDIKNFLLAAELQNFSAVGRIENITPSAVLKSIARLENATNLILFSKHSGKARLTPAGRKLQEKLSWTTMAFEEAVMALMTDPEAVSDLAGAIADRKIEIAENAAKYYKPDYFTILDDYAFKNGPFMSLDTFRTIFKPHYKRIVDAVHSFGMKFKTHCCGKMESFLDDFVEIGVDAFDPVQCFNNIPEMKKKTVPNHIGLMGGMDVQGIVDIIGAKEEDIRAEVRRCIDEYAAGGGYMLFGTSINMYY